MTPLSVIVCELRDRWALRLRPALAAVGVPLRQTRRLVDCRAEVAASRSSLVLLEWSPERRGELAEFVDATARRFPQANLVALAEPAAAGDEPLAREAGVVHFASSPRELGPVVRLAVRMRRQTPAHDEVDDWLAGLLPGDSDERETD